MNRPGLDLNRDQHLNQHKKNGYQYEGSKELKLPKVTIGIPLQRDIKLNNKISNVKKCTFRQDKSPERNALNANDAFKPIPIKNSFVYYMKRNFKRKPNEPREVSKSTEEQDNSVNFVNPLLNFQMSSPIRSKKCVVLYKGKSILKQRKPKQTLSYTFLGNKF